MRWTRAFIPTLKETPSDAEIASHRLMLRAGMMRKLSSGIYTLLPLGMRSVRKMAAIVREEMNRAGAHELLMPVLSPAELWRESGRWDVYGDELMRIRDRHKRPFALGPTHEEIITDLVRKEVRSYRELPLTLYQIQTKFRDEIRPRFGVMRAREFMMKDAYSFDANAESLHKSYMAMYDAYCRVFQRCGVEYVIVEAETGEMGGSGSHQFTVPCASGEDTTVFTEDGSYAANLEKAAVDPLVRQAADPDTPAPENVHTPNVGTIEAVCGFLKTQPAEMIKTLIYTVGDETVAALVRGDHELNPEKLTQILGGAHSELADEAAIEEVTGAKVGFAGPVGLANRVSKLIVDHAVAAMSAGVTGANRTDYHTRNIVPGRDFPLDGDHIVVADIRNAVEGDTYQGKPLRFKRGIEVGQVFKLGTKYSKKLGATFLDENGVESPCLMGCYGIGINRIMASAIELYNDKNGIIWPISIAPFEVSITAVNQDDPDVVRVGGDIYEALTQAGIEVLLDDRDLRAGIKFKDADLIGIPVRVTVGKRSVAEGTVEIKLRASSDSEKVPVDQAPARVVELVGSLKAQLETRVPATS